MSSIQIPKGAPQNTGNTFSPVLEIKADRLVVISGQPPTNAAGSVVGKTTAEQTVQVMQNCAEKLEMAGCTLADVFKVNVYLIDIAAWGEFNEAYSKFMQAPYPVRTTVQTPLAPGFLVEIEMWAAL